MIRPAPLLALLLAALLALASPAAAWARAADGTAAAAPAAGPVVELLRLRVPERQRPAWQKAEQLVWEPWLRQQPGFLSREILWDPDHAEALVLIHWASLADWRSIPEAAIERQQRRYERLAGVGRGGFPVLESRTLEPGAA
jgi:uncharacterized protein (TIGR03792 family)